MEQVSIVRGVPFYPAAAAGCSGAARPAATRRGRGAVLFHTYEWDAYTERQAQALAARSRGLDFYVLADETNGGVAATGFRKIAHTGATFIGQGLPLYRGLWWNADYALYHAASVLPDYDYYLRFDPDVRVTVDLAEIMEHMRRTGRDWLTLPLRGISRWPFRASATALPYQRVVYVPLMAMMISRDALRLLEAERCVCARARAGHEPWAFCEAFVPSALLEHGVSIGGLGKVADTGLFRAELALLESDERLARPGGFYHAVLDVPRLCGKLDRLVRHLLRLGDQQELERVAVAATLNGFRRQFEAALDRRATAHNLVSLVQSVTREDSRIHLRT